MALQHEGSALAPVQKARGLAKKVGMTMYVYANPRPDPRGRKAHRHLYIIADTNPGQNVWPLTEVHPDGTTTRRPEPSHV